MKTLQLPIKQGGLGLVSIHKREISLKSSWIKIVHNNEKIANLAYTALKLPRSIGELIWQCNLNKKDIKNMWEQGFWTDVLCALSETNCCADKIQRRVIWYNSDIRIGDRPILWERPLQKGLLSVEDLFENKKLISIEYAQETFGLNYIELYQLWYALPKTYKNYLCNESENDQLSWMEKCVLDSNLTRTIYSKIPLSIKQNKSFKVGKKK